jgi:hypothetical protein
LSCNKVTPCADWAGDDIDKPLDWEDATTLVIRREARLAICLGTVAAKGVIPSISVNMEEYGAVGQVSVFIEMVVRFSKQSS